jgi:hypothetical protein
MRIILIFLLFLISCGTPSTVPIDNSQGVPLITVSINGEQAVMIMDTGGAVTVIDDDYLNVLKIKELKSSTEIVGYGGTKNMSLTNENEIVIGDIPTFSDIFVTDLDYILNGTNIVGILGIGHLKSGSAKIDFETNTISVQ